MRRAALLFALALPLGTAGCPPPAESPPTVSLRMTGSPPDARVIIDDEFVGPLDVVVARGVALPPGQHRISVEAPGYFPFDTIVVAKEGERLIRVQARLMAVPE